MKTEIDKKKRSIDNIDTNRLEAGSFITGKDGKRVPNLNDKTMKAREELKKKSEKQK